MKKIEPTNDNVLVRKHKLTASNGIVIPDSVQPKGQLAEATVVAVGPGGFHYKTGAAIKVPKIKKGNVILIDEYAGDKIDAKLGAEVIVQMHEIKAVIR